MTDIECQLEADLVAATRLRSAELTVLRCLKSALHNEKIAKQIKADLPVADVVAVLRRELKKRQEAAAMYQQAGRIELANKEDGEASVITRYLPPAPEQAEVIKVINRFKQEQGLAGASAIGPLTKAVLAHFNGTVDGQTVSRLVREALSQ